MRLIQQARKDADLQVTDRIAVQVGLPAAQQAMVAAHEAYVREQVLADELAFGSPAEGTPSADIVLDGQNAVMSVRTSGG